MNRLIEIKSITWLVAGLLCFFMVFPSGDTWAQRKVTQKKVAMPAKYGKVVKRLPADHRIVRRGKINYHYAKGFFYRPKGHHWVVVHPPIGAVVAALSATAMLVTVSGAQYYLCEGVYYKKVPAGYEVVEITETSVAPHVPGERVQVTAQLLNLRSGPGKRHRVIRQLSQGSILTIKGNAPSWLYVELENGTNGWVMKAFTVIVKPAAQG